MSAAPSLLVIAYDRFEPFRVDVRVLFARELVARGYRIDWLLQSERDCDRDYVVPWGGGQAWVGRTDNGRSRLARVRKHLLAIANELRVFGLLRKRRYDCVIVKDEFIAPLFALVAARLAGVPFYYWLSYPFPEESLWLARQGRARYPVLYTIRGHLFRFLLYRIILPASRHVLVQSEQMKRDVIAAGIPADKLTPVLMGVDLARVPYSDPGGVPAMGRTQPPAIVYLGTLIRVRHLEFLMRAFARVRRDVPDARLVMIGDGDDPSDRALLVAEAEQCGVAEAVEFTGFMPMEDAWQRVAEAAVCVSPIHPSPVLNAGSPTKLIEYMAMGKAVVANDHPEQRQVIAASGGGLCVPWDEAEFAAATVQLLRDPGLAADMGRRGRRYVEQARDYRVIAREVDEMFRARLTGFAQGRPANARPAT